MESVKAVEGGRAPHRPVRHRLLFGLHRRQPRRCDFAPRGLARTRPSCGPRTAAGSFTVAPAETQAARHLDRASPARMTRWNSSRTGRSRAWCGPIPTTSPIPSCWRSDAETSRQINTANAIWTRGQVGDHADQHKEFFGHLSGSYCDPAITHPLPCRGPQRIHRAALRSGRDAPSTSSIPSGAAARSSM